MAAEPVRRGRVAPADRHLIALDLDGTVLEHRPDTSDLDGIIHTELGAAIKLLHDVGHEVVIATGRSSDATLPVVERLKIRPDWVIAANGAVTLKRDPLATRAYRREIVESFDPSDALKRIRTQLTTAHYAVELADGRFLYTQPIPTGTLPAAQTRVTFDELLGVQATRVVVVSPDHRLEDFLSVVDTIGLTHVSYAVGSTAWLDIAPGGVTKASALEVVLKKLGINRNNVFAAGDGRNDIQMLEWASHGGDAVAMGQAPEDVQRVASRVTGTVEESGLLTALRDRFPDLLG